MERVRALQAMRTELRRERRLSPRERLAEYQSSSLGAALFVAAATVTILSGSPQPARAHPLQIDSGFVFVSNDTVQSFGLDFGIFGDGFGSSLNTGTRGTTSSGFRRIISGSCSRPPRLYRPVRNAHRLVVTSCLKRQGRHSPPNGSPPGRLARLQVLVYHARSERLVESLIPFWFYRMKAPAAQFALEGTGVDLERLGVTASELERYGPRLVLEHRGSTGDHVLVWTE